MAVPYQYRRYKNPIIKLSSIVLVLLIYHIFGSFFPQYVFPNVIETIDAMELVYTGSTEYSPIEHYPITFIRILLIFLIAVPLGLAVGVGMGLSRDVESVFSPYVLISLAFPSIVWAFLGVIWFGLTTYLVPVFVGVLITAPYVAINAVSGTKDLDRDLIEMAETYDASQWFTWRYIVIPHLQPYIYSMMRIVLAVSWKVMLVAEIFGTQSGLGFMVNEYFMLRRNDMIIAWILPALLGIFVLERLLKFQEERQFSWRAQDAMDRGVAIGGG